MSPSITVRGRPVEIDYTDKSGTLSVCGWLVRDGNPDEAEPVLTELATDPEVGLDARRLLAVCRQLRHWGILDEIEPLEISGAEAQPIDFEDESKVLFCRRDSSARVLFVFTGSDKQMWLSVKLIHSVLRRFDWNIVYLRDPGKRVGYGSGLQQFGPGFAGTISAIRDFVATLGAQKVYCFGNSSGGYAALRYGLELGAEAVLTFSPTTTSPRETEPEDTLIADDDFVDLAAPYRERSAVPRVTIVFGDGHADDAATARHIAALPGVRLVPMIGCDRHDVVAEAILRDQFMPLVTDLSNGKRTDPAAASKV